MSRRTKANEEAEAREGRPGRPLTRSRSASVVRVRQTGGHAAVGVGGAARAPVASGGAPPSGARPGGAGRGLRGDAPGARALGVVAVAGLSLVRAAAADTGAGLARHARIAVVAAEEDEHLGLGGDAALQRARVAHAVVGAWRAVAVAIVAEALLTALGGVHAVDVLVRAAGGPALPADADALEGRVGRGRVALHGLGVGVAVVVDGAELEPPRHRIVTVERQRRRVDDLRRVFVRGRGHDRRRRLGQAGRRIGRGAVARLGDAGAPDAEQPAALVGVRAQVRHARSLPEERRAAVLDLLERGHVLDEDVVGVEDAAQRVAQIVGEPQVEPLLVLDRHVEDVEGVRVPDDGALDRQLGVDARRIDALDARLLRAAERRPGLAAVAGGAALVVGRPEGD